MEGLTAETCSLDGSRQTNYIQLMPMTDGDSLTQPAFGYLTTTGASMSAVRSNSSGDAASSRSILLKNSGANGGVILLVPTAAIAISAGAQSGLYLSSSSTSTTTAPVAPLASEASSTSSGFTDVQNESGSVARRGLSPARSFDAEAQLEAPCAADCERNAVLAESARLPAPRNPPSIRRWKLKISRSNGPNGDVGGRSKGNKRGGWPKGKRRKKSHPRLNEPTPPATAYVIYSRERRPLVRIENPEASNAELVRMIGNEWTMLSKIEKQKYAQKAKEDLDRYKKELREYQQSPEYLAFVREKRDRKRLQLNDASGECTAESASDALGQLDNLVSMDSVVTQDTAGLYCADCDVYFVSQHNKSEHFRSQRHLKRTVGEFEKYWRVNAPDPEPSPPSTNATECDLADWKLPEPLDMQEYVSQFIMKNHEVTLELNELRKTVRVMKEKIAEKNVINHKLKARHGTLKQDLVQVKLQRVVCSQQLANLRAIPLLFETEDYLT